MYQVLYRKYRPKVFSDVVGQEHITTTLSREIETGKLAHAYLFTGSRGTGKTTCAKILAKACNCLHPIDGNPCNECEICKGIDNGSILDVVEIDAASNNGVDNIRDIRDEAAFAPANCKYRVYIIDEVHMLSIGAFNALLKTLEEPPQHVKFILATTEVHKLPVTIISRCQRFDFKRVNADSMISRMNDIAQAEGFGLEAEAATLISRLSDGGMRDALSTLDQCVGKGDPITAEIVAEVAGITGKDHLFELADAVGEENTAKCISIINTLHNNSFDMERLCGDLINHFRNLMIVKTVKEAENVLVCTASEIENYKAQSQKFTLEAILYSIDLLQNCLANIKRGVNRRIEMEMTVIKLSSKSASGDSASILKRIANLERMIKNGVVPVDAGSSAVTESERVTEPKPDNAPTDSENPNSLGQPKPEQKMSSTAEQLIQWPQILSELSTINKPLWGILSDSTAYIENDIVMIKCDNPTFPTFIRTGKNPDDLKEAIFRVISKPCRLKIYRGTGTKPTEKKKTDPLDDFLAKAKTLGVNISEE